MHAHTPPHHTTPHHTPHTTHHTTPHTPAVKHTERKRRPPVLTQLRLNKVIAGDMPQEMHLHRPLSSNSTQAQQHGTVQQHATQRKKVTLSPSTFRIGDHRDWPPSTNLSNKSKWDIPDDGRLNAPRKSHSKSSDTASYDTYGFSAHVSVFDRLSCPRASGQMNELKEKRVKPRAGGYKLKLCTNGSVVSTKIGTPFFHGGFNPEVFNAVLVARFRWRHACAKALAFGKNKKSESLPMKAHNTLKVVCGVSIAMNRLKKNRITEETRTDTTPHETTGSASGPETSTLQNSKGARNTMSPAPAMYRKVSGAGSTLSSRDSVVAPPRASPITANVRTQAQGSKLTNIARLAEIARTDKTAKVLKTSQSGTHICNWKRPVCVETWKRNYFTGSVVVLRLWEQNARDRLLLHRRNTVDGSTDGSIDANSTHRRSSMAGQYRRNSRHGTHGTLGTHVHDNGQDTEPFIPQPTTKHHTDPRRQ
jgi:hypothetical protein